ncbi:hypothetical protein GCM10008955_39250 [Deinococcus malanensis]|uniref:DUF309 domain-containing protein n=1 Tax=Deinococcus malanensis TaxID=1706855 RepID=A0ABQ2F244_9DEIO|nr:hypothetical protein GCM10008955_39250 [Deinococcus malanensis]
MEGAAVTLGSVSTAPSTHGNQEAWTSGVALFNAGHWWEAHEAWEPLWLQAAGAERHFLQGVILLAAALHKRWVHGSLTHRNYHKALRHLEQLPPGYAARTRGIDVARLRHEVWEALHDPARRPALPLPDGSGIL